MSETYDFGGGPVPAHPHPNGGGWVADTATVAPSAYVGVGARVYDAAQVHGDAQVFGHGRVFGRVQLSGGVWVSDNALVSSAVDILTGHVGGYSWTAYRCSRGWRLRYGCEEHPLSAWRALHSALAISHTGSAAHAIHTRAVEAEVRAHIASLS